MSDTRLYGLPSPTPTQFNTAAEKIAGKGALVWTDANDDKKLDVSELSGEKVSQYVAKKTFTPGFEKMYRNLAEQIRQESVAKELTYTFRKTITNDMGATLKAMPKSLNITDAEIALYKRGTAKLLEVAPLMQTVYELQAGFTADMKRAVTSANDLELISRYGHPWCVSDTSDMCSALPTFAAHTSGMIASDIECKELGEVLTGPAGPFTAVVRDGGKLKTIPVATLFAAQMQPAAKDLREAAEIFAKIPREKVFAQYLAQLADDFGSTEVFPYTQSDALWMEHQKSDSILYARIGPDENGGVGASDKCGAKSMFHFSVGVKNFLSADLSTQFKPKLQGWEDKYAALVGDEKVYKAQKVAVSLPDFLDILYQNGDDTGGPNGTPIGQSLPNWCGKDGLQEPCARRTMIYVNKTAGAYSKDMIDKFVLPLFHPSQRGLYTTGNVGLSATVQHELAHNLGPQPGKKKPGTDSDYGSSLGKWKGMIEEFKAQMGSLYFPTIEIQAARADAKSGKITARQLAAAEESFAHDMVYNMAWSFGHITRATRTGEFKGGSAYAKLSAATVGYLAEKGAMSFDTDTKTWKLDFDKFPAAVESLTQKVVGMYARSEFPEVDTFMTHYMSGDGFKGLHIDRLQEIAGKKPSVNFSYEISDLTPMKTVGAAHKR